MTNFFSNSIFRKFWNDWVASFVTLSSVLVAFAWLIYDYIRYGIVVK